jgi:dolichol-phosphate mannosyltransferase
LGYGKALVKGYQYAMKELKADVVIPIDVDFQWDPFLAPKLLEKIDEGYDVAVASRGVSGSKDYFNWFRKLTHWVSDTIFAYYWAGIKEVNDHAGAFKAIRVKGVLDKVDFDNLNVMGFVIQMKTIYELSKTGAKFAEVAAIYGSRRSGESTTVGLKSLSWFAKYMIEYIKIATQIRLERSRQFIKFGTVGLVGFAINALGLELFFRLGASPGLAAAGGAELAIISNFTFNNLWTFSERKITKTFDIGKKFLMFNLTSAGAVLIQFVVVGAGTKFTSEAWRQIWLVIAVGFFIIPYNWLMYNKIIWKKK